MRRIVVLASLLLLVLTAVPAEAAVVSVGSGGDDTFDPQVTTLTAPGQDVTWDWAVDVNNSPDVHQDRGRFSSPFASSPDAEFARTFSAGNFHHNCQLHGTTTGGMAGRVRVPVLITAAPTGLPFTVRWRPPPRTSVRSSTSNTAWGAARGARGAGTPPLGRRCSARTGSRSW